MEPAQAGQKVSGPQETQETDSSNFFFVPLIAHAAVAAGKGGYAGGLTTDSTYPTATPAAVGTTTVVQQEPEASPSTATPQPTAKPAVPAAAPVAAPSSNVMQTTPSLPSRPSPGATSTAPGSPAVVERATPAALNATAVPSVNRTVNAPTKVVAPPPTAGTPTSVVGTKTLANTTTAAAAVTKATVNATEAAVPSQNAAVAEGGEEEEEEEEDAATAAAAATKATVNATKAAVPSENTTAMAEDAEGDEAATEGDEGADDEDEETEMVPMANATTKAPATNATTAAAGAKAAANTTNGPAGSKNATVAEGGEEEEEEEGDAATGEEEEPEDSPAGNTTTTTTSTTVPSTTAVNKTTSAAAVTVTAAPTLNRTATLPSTATTNATTAAAATTAASPIANKANASSTARATNLNAPFIFDQPGSTSTILIGCLTPEEGDQASVGAAVRAALQLAIIDTAPSTVPGVNINLTCLNSKCLGEPASLAASELADDGAVALIGEICSGASVAAAEVANKRKVPMISPASTSSALSQTDLFYRTVPSDKSQGGAAAKLLYQKGARNVGLVYEDTPYGYYLGANFLDGFTKAGGNVPVVYQFKPGQGSPADALTKLLAGVSKPSKAEYKLDAVFLATSNLTFVADFLVGAQKEGLKLNIYGGDALADPTLYARVGGRNSAISQLAAITVAPGNASFIAKFKEFTDAQHQVWAAHAYDAMVAYLKAYKAAPIKDAPAIAGQLSKLKFEGASGTIEFDQNNDVKPTDFTYMWTTFTEGVPAVQDFVSGRV
eukprot:gene2011-2333_t